MKRSYDAIVVGSGFGGGVAACRLAAAGRSVCVLERGRRLVDLGVRSHWGQYNRLTGERIREVYPRFEDWLEIERELNASRVFDSPFSSRVGIRAGG